MLRLGRAVIRGLLRRRPALLAHARGPLVPVPSARCGQRGWPGELPHAQRPARPAGHPPGTGGGDGPRGDSARSTWVSRASRPPGRGGRAARWVRDACPAVEHLRSAGAAAGDITAYIIIGHPDDDEQAVEESMACAHAGRADHAGGFFPRARHAGRRALPPMGGPRRAACTTRPPSPGPAWARADSSTSNSTAATSTQACRHQGKVAGSGGQGQGEWVGSDESDGFLDSRPLVHCHAERPVNVVCVQFDIAWEDKPANFATVRRLLGRDTPSRRAWCCRRCSPRLQHERGRRGRRPGRGGGGVPGRDGRHVGDVRSGRGGHMGRRRAGAESGPAGRPTWQGHRPVHQNAPVFLRRGGPPVRRRR